MTFRWASGADGAATVTTTKRFTGEVIRLITVPGTGSDQPSDDYDVYVYDEDGTDVLVGGGLNRDEVNTEQVLASSLGIVANDTLRLVVAAAGDTKRGTVYVYIR